MSAPETVLACPFCGAAHMYVRPDEYGDGMFGIDGAHKPGCIIGNIDLCDYGEPELAIAAWNTRAATASNAAMVGQIKVGDIQEAWDRVNELPAILFSQEEERELIAELRNIALARAKASEVQP